MKKAIALGTFDGLHKGHREVLQGAAGYDLTVLTFKTPPKSVITGKSELLMSLNRRFEGLYELGASDIIALDFTEVRDTLPEDFLEKITRRYSPALIVCGFNYRFGKGAVGDTDMLSRYCSEKGIELKCCEPVYQNGDMISSSRIRGMIRSGEMKSAAEAVYGGFSFEAEVISGDRRGRTLGFPTINQKYPDGLVLPKFGVYAVKVCFDGKILEGIANIGHRPTYKTREVFSETYIKDFSGDLYGKAVTVKPIAFLREEREFSSEEELKSAIQTDIESISKI